MSNNVQRVLVAAVGIPLALGVVWYGGLPLALLVSLVGFLGTRELFDIAERTGVRPMRTLGLFLAVLAPLATWMLAYAPTGDVRPPPIPVWFFSQWPLILTAAPIVVLAAALWRRSPTERPLAATAVTLFGPLYCSVLPATLLVLRYSADGSRSWAATWLVFFPLAVTWLCDSFAMWGGKLFGGPKLAPIVSPGKTRSGALSGLVGGVVTAVVFVPLALEPVGRGFPVLTAALIGLILSIAAQVGDLAESLLKREVGVKDSSHLIPGHGGVLDRFDSLYFVLPTATLLFRAFGVI
ncbi:MAG: phosphatidate cytidylyltransferase [Gemmatimonadales bacterium]|nr:phosphatidate cytidylyltransferase [Gemmatimonadales bacterium]